MSAPEVILGPAGRTESPAAAHLRASFAQRHVALPAGMADGLARFLAARQPLLDPFWGRAFTCMARALDVSGAVVSQSLVKGVLDRFLVVVAEPVLRRAAQAAGMLPLAAAAAPAVDARWDGAEAAIRRQAEAALADPQVMGRPFWVHAALDIHLAALRAARQRTRHGAPPAPGPETDPALAALVFLHPPRFDEAQLRERHRRRARQVSAHRRAGVRPKEGGVAGIRQSHSFEDLPDSLFSELIQPRALLANKLLHEGLLVRHRPPRRNPRRDLLAVTALLADPGDGMGLLAKAAWADAAIRLRVALHQMGLGNSDLVWAPAAGAAAHLDCAIDQGWSGCRRWP